MGSVCKGSDERGAVFVEKLIVVLPLLATFFLTWELAEYTAANIVVQRACGAAGRAAMVVLSDDPQFYDGDAVGSFEGQRRGDIELAAGMVLSAIPRLNANFTVDVEEPQNLGDTFSVSVAAQYDCGMVSLLCGDSAALALSATTQHTYHGAKYDYSSPSPVGGGTAALTDTAAGGGRLRAKQNGNGTNSGTGNDACTDCSDCKGKQQRINELQCQIEANTASKKKLEAGEQKCLTDENKTLGNELKKLKAETRTCECKGQTGPKYKCPYINNYGKLDELITECKNKFGTGGEAVEYYRVQGGDPPNASRYRVEVNTNGDFSVPEKGVLCVSTGDLDHAEYFKNKRNEGGPKDKAKIYKWKMPAWFDKCVKQHETYQKNYSSGKPEDCRRNLGGLAPKIVDPNQPGDSYEFNPPWDKAFEKYAIPGSGSICE